MNNNGLPHNIEAEKALIGSVFLSQNALQKACEEVSKEAFYLDSHGKIFEVIQDLYQNKKPIDATTVTSEIINKGYLNQIGGVEYLTNVIGSVATGANVSYYIDTVLEKYTLRKMIETATSIIKNLFIYIIFLFFFIFIKLLILSSFFSSTFLLSSNFLSFSSFLLSPIPNPHFLVIKYY